MCNLCYPLILVSVTNNFNLSSGFNFNMTLSSESQFFVFPIVNNDLLEINKAFTAEISLTRMEDRRCVVLRPSTAVITILGDDGEAKLVNI